MDFVKGALSYLFEIAMGKNSSEKGMRRDVHDFFGVTVREFLDKGSLVSTTRGTSGAAQPADATEAGGGRPGPSRVS